MMTPRALRRATLNGAGLALLASLACATPAAAQTMNVAETLAYINERCEGHIFSWTAGSTETTGRSIVNGTHLTVPITTSYVEDGVARPSLIFNWSFDIRHVDVRGETDGASRPFIFFECGTLTCFSRRDVAIRDLGGGRHRREESLVGPLEYGPHIRCRQTDRVVNALKHLQQLVGGRIADPVDPFAN